MISIFKKLFGFDLDEELSDKQLWVMIKESEYFRDDAHLSIADDIAEIFEKNNLGELDGHSSGAHQFEINYFDVNNFESAKNAVVSYFKSKHPNIEYTVSEEYETIYESSL